MSEISPDDFEESKIIFEGFEKCCNENGLDCSKKMHAAACFLVFYWNVIKNEHCDCSCPECEKSLEEIFVSYILHMKNNFNKLTNQF